MATGALGAPPSRSSRSRTTAALAGTVLRPLGEHLQQQRVERGRDPRRVARRRLRLGEAVRGEQRERVGAGEGRAAREQLPERRAERVDVGLRLRRRARRLLGRLVVRRAGGQPGGLDGAEHDRDAEVAEAGGAVAREPDVVRLDVAVHDVVGVRVGERVRDGAAGAQHIRHRHPAAGRGGERRRQRAAVHVAHDDVQLPAVVERVEDGDHVRVVAEPGHEPRLAPHPLAHLLARGARERPRDRDRPLERQVVGEPDLLGAAAAEQPLRPVAPGHQPRGVRRRRDGGRGERVVGAAGPARIVPHARECRSRG